ncbi:MAG: HEAT repeat domain-containing protein [bacterium]
MSDMSHRRALYAGLVASSLVAGAASLPAQARHRPLGETELNDIAHFLMLENRREFDSASFRALLDASHPEVRRRATLAVARILDRRGLAMLRARPLDADTALAATTVFAVGQFHDTTAVAWLDSLLSSAHTAPTVADEAAIALGKIKAPSVRIALARYLDATPLSARYSAALASALLSIGRSARGDIAPIVRWTTAPNEELRWRAAWALYRPRDPAAVATLLTMSRDRSALVRSWAIRGLARPQADSANLLAQAQAALLAAVSDKDRRVQTEALHTLASYSDSATIGALARALESPDSWISVPAAEGLGRLKAVAMAPQLRSATSSRRPCAVRVVAMQALQATAPGMALQAVLDLAHDSVSFCGNIALQALTRVESGATQLDDAAPSRQALLASLDSLRSARRTELESKDVATRLTALRSIAAWGDSTDLLRIADVLRRAETESPAVSMLATSVTATLRRRLSAPATPPSPGQPRAPTPPVTRPLSDYREIVQRWIVPEYNRGKHPVARWSTPRGVFDVELFAGDAPLATDDFVRTMESGAMLGTEFTRVVSDFVAQQQPIRSGNVLRDEVNRHGLLRANLAWATAGLDTGTPGYTLGHTAQPHNEGDFTALGRVIRGMDVVDRLELGDRIVSAKMLPLD